MKRLKGFTLVELVITIAIVIILSVVSVPIYRSYTKQAKMAEGYALLGVILSAQKAYYSQYGYFLHGSKSSAGAANAATCNDEVLGIDARGNKYFTAFSVNGGWGATGLDHKFTAVAIKPEELRNSPENNALRLTYIATMEPCLSYSENASY